MIRVSEDKRCVSLSGRDLDFIKEISRVKRISLEEAVAFAANLARLKLEIEKLSGRLDFLDSFQAM